MKGEIADGSGATTVGRCLVSLSIVLASVIIGACADEREPTAMARSTDAVVATVGGHPILAEALRQEMVRRGGYRGNQVSGAATRQAALGELIRVETLAAAARDAGLDKDPQLAEAYTRLLAERYWREEWTKLAAGTQPSDDEVRAFYDANTDPFREPVRARGAVIYLRYPAAASAADKAHLRTTAEQVLADSKGLAASEQFFGDLARKFSADPLSARRGGDIGWVVQGASIAQWEPAVVEALFTLETPGQVAPLVEGERGIYLVRLVERSAGGKKPLASVEREIRGRIAADKAQKAQASLMDRLRTRFPVKVNEEALQLVGTSGSEGTKPDAPPAFPIATD